MLKMTTHKYQGLTGIEFEVSDMSAKHQRLFSQSERTSINSANMILADLIKRIGSLQLSSLSEAERIGIIKRLPTEERKKALYEIRQFTLDFEEEFTFNFQYLSKLENTHGQRLESTQTVVLKKIINEVKYPNQASELDDLAVDFEGVFPRSEVAYKFHLPDGFSEEIAAKTKNISSHTPILMCEPKELRTKNKQGELLKEPQWVIIDSDKLDKLSIKDVEHLRKHIKMNDGKFDSLYTFEHPESDLYSNSKYETVDILQLPAFFFPSLMI